jgi:hypothetical protein
VFAGFMRDPQRRGEAFKLHHTSVTEAISHPAERRAVAAHRPRKALFELLAAIGNYEA